jgi:hypothetical protein
MCSDGCSIGGKIADHHPCLKWMEKRVLKRFSNSKVFLLLFFFFAVDFTLDESEMKCEKRENIKAFC